MKKTYEELQINVISLDSEDVIATSGPTLATRNSSLLDQDFNFNGLNVQEF